MSDDELTRHATDPLNLDRRPVDLLPLLHDITRMVNGDPETVRQVRDSGAWRAEERLRRKQPQNRFQQEVKRSDEQPEPHEGTRASREPGRFVRANACADHRRYTDRDEAEVPDTPDGAVVPNHTNRAGPEEPGEEKDRDHCRDGAARALGDRRIHGLTVAGGPRP